MTWRTAGSYVVAVIVALVGCVLIVGAIVLGVRLVNGHTSTPPASPGPEWQHQDGSIYWTCTSDGHALIRDVDTGSTMLDRDDRKCDSGG